jgi:hypothetical protein
MALLNIDKKFLIDIHPISRSQTKNIIIGISFRRAMVSFIIPETSIGNPYALTLLLPNKHLNNILIPWQIEIFQFLFDRLGNFFGKCLDSLDLVCQHAV